MKNTEPSQAHPAVKLIIQIPCYNEAETLPAVIRDLPAAIPGVDVIETLVVDDGSIDNTAEKARSLGVNHVVRLPRNLGLARAFRAGIEACLALGADIVVNTDGDNQYCGADVPKLVEPILAGTAEMVVGERPIESIAHFSVLKKLLERAGSGVVGKLSGLRLRDAPSGFRAFARSALMRLSLQTEYSHTLETLIQAGRMRMAVVGVPIATNRRLRESRLMRSTTSYIGYSAATMLRVWLKYSALRVFLGTAAVFIAGGLALGIRFLYFYSVGQGQGHIQSLILTAVLFFIGFQLVVLGLLADLISTNRRMLEEIGDIVRHIRHDQARPQGL
jgi:glycosyltransferase involved in cell wall biosynthesis